MNEKPTIWHYGLMAERWAKCIHDTPELPYLQQQIARFGQPVLDVACGTGRLLLPLLRAGIEIDGCDYSGDMLAYCRQQAHAEEYQPALYQEPMAAFSFRRQYSTIFIAGSFGLAGSREQDLATLRCCYEHLAEGGALLFNIQAEYVYQDAWDMWLTEPRPPLPEPWPAEGSRRVAADGSEHIAWFRTLAIDPLEQRYVRQARLEKWQTGECVGREEVALHGNMYLKNEVLLMLQVAGFREVTVCGDYTDQPATAADDELVFVAVKTS